LLRGISMKYDFNREWLTKKFEEIRRRTIKSIDQLSDDQLNCSLDEYSNNIPTLLRHIEGNIKERIIKGISNNEIVRDREKEFSRAFMTKGEAELIIINNFQFVIDVINALPDERFEEIQIVRGKERTNLDMIHQCAAHYSEHMGQILYIVKHILKEKYKSTSV
jgi:2-hydroxy-3-keto-5-methylthiopentenyl-1-phosphate phosphatase